MLLKVWNSDKFRGSYRRFRGAIVSRRLPASQSPSYFFAGDPDRAFEAQGPSRSRGYT